MKKNLSIALCCLAASFAATAALAHGGMKMAVGNAVITLYQSPISPLVGEPVTMTFALASADGDVLADHEVKLTLTDTFTGDESKDRVVLVKTFRTDANGDFEFDQTFPNPDYFDVDISFLEPDSGKEVEWGTLVQSRLIPSPALPMAEAAAAGFVTGLLAAATVVLLRWRRKKNRQEGPQPVDNSI